MSSDKCTNKSWIDCFDHDKSSDITCEPIIYIVASCCTLSVLASIITIATFIYCSFKKSKERSIKSKRYERTDWKHDFLEILQAKENYHKDDTEDSHQSPTSKQPQEKSSRRDLQQTVSLGSISSTLNRSSQLFGDMFYFDGRPILLKDIIVRQNNLPNTDTQFVSEVRTLMRLSLQHRNIIGFYGLTINEDFVFKLEEYCTRGSLVDIMYSGHLNIDVIHQVSWIYQMIDGLSYLHTALNWSHGNFKTHNCAISANLTLKITDFTLPSIRHLLSKYQLISREKLLWKAPELLRQEAPETLGTFKGDIYSFAIVVHELSTNKGPFCIQLSHENIENILRKVQVESSEGGERPFRPPLIDEINEAIVRVMIECWSENPSDRPSWEHIRDVLMKPLEAMNLSQVLHDYAFVDAEIRKKKIENTRYSQSPARQTDFDEKVDLIRRMIPDELLEEICGLKPRRAHSSGTCTLTFSDVKNFTVICDFLDPSEVAVLLNELYQIIDSILESRHHQFVRKIETIGDAYMAACGICPVYANHAALICVVANDIQQALQRFEPSVKKITQKGHRIEMRTGVHTGTATYSIIGALCPRYVVLGETVKIAEEMEKTGEPGRVHISEKTFEELKSMNALKAFKVFKRVNPDSTPFFVEFENVKISTYWITSKRSH